jgi:CHAT domain-containing protein
MYQKVLEKNWKLRLFLAFTLIISLKAIVFAQPENKSAQAKAALAEGERLAETKNIPSFNQALEKFWLAKRLFNELNNSNGEGKSALEAGSILHQLDRAAEALEEYQRAYQLFKSIGKKIPQAQAANYIGVIYSGLGQKKLAFQLYNHAVRLFFEMRSQDPDSFYYAIEAINNVGDMYLAFGDKENAKFYYELGLPVVRAENDQAREAMILQNLGDLYLKFGEPEKAFGFYQQALQILEKTDFDQGHIRALNNIGVNAFRIGKKQESVDYFNRALKLNSSRFKASEALSLHYLLSVWKEMGNQNLGIFYGKQAVNKYQELRSSIRTLDPKIQGFYLKTIENTYRQLADLLISQGQFAQAEQVLQMLKEEEFFDFVRRDASEIKNLEKRVALTEKERELIKRYSLLAEKITRLGKEFEKLDNRKRKLSRSNADLGASERNAYEDLSKQLADANAAFKLFLDKQLVAELGKRVTKEIEYDRNLQAKLRKWGNGTVALYTVVTENRYRVILTTPTVQIDGKTEIKAAELNKKIFAYRDALQNLEVDPRPLGKELYDILLKPIEKELQAAGAKTLVWSLDGTLRYIPLATLSPDGQSYLVEKYQSVILTPKTRDDVSDKNTEWKALGVGVTEGLSVINPANKQEQIEFAPLPATEKELKTIVRDESIKDEKGILAGKRYLDKDFTMRSFADSLTAENSDGNRKYTVVHIASHFRLGNNWSDSFLLLGDGKTLTLEEISNSPEITFGDVELVTLSACDTAFANNANGKEVDSLAEAIQTKSGKAVLATLWAVADESTSLLMSDFYRSRQTRPNMTKAESMQQTQRSMLNGTIQPSAEYIKKLEDYFNSINKKEFIFDKNKPFAHPYFWSPFVLIGNWR